MVCMLLGFYIASSSIAPTISDLTTNVAGMISSIEVLTRAAEDRRQGGLGGAARGASGLVGWSP